MGGLAAANRDRRRNSENSVHMRKETEEADKQIELRLAVTDAVFCVRFCLSFCLTLCEQNSSADDFAAEESNLRVRDEIDGNALQHAAHAA